jgi:hypothetical protein
MEAFLLALVKLVEAIGAKGVAGLGTFLEAIGLMGVTDWMWSHPEITLGALFAAVYFTFVAARRSA